MSFRVSTLINRVKVFIFKNVFSHNNRVINVIKLYQQITIRKFWTIRENATKYFLQYINDESVPCVPSAQEMVLCDIQNIEVPQLS